MRFRFSIRIKVISIEYFSLKNIIYLGGRKTDCFWKKQCKGLIFLVVCFLYACEQHRDAFRCNNILLVWYTDLCEHVCACWDWISAWIVWGRDHTGRGALLYVCAYALLGRAYGKKQRRIPTSPKKNLRSVAVITFPTSKNRNTQSS